MNKPFKGTKNWALELKKINEKKNLNAHYFVGVEGGILNIYSRWFAFGGMCVMDNSGTIGFGTSLHYELPSSISDELLKGIELGDVMDKIMNQQNTKKKCRAIAFFTNNNMDRRDFYVQGLIVAMAPHLKKELF
jgi:inosine/xanthosine triphosphatase